MAPSIWQLLIVLAIVALIFGTKRLRNIGGDLGGAIKSFRSGLKDDDGESVEDQREEEQAASSETENETDKVKQDQ